MIIITIIMIMIITIIIITIIMIRIITILISKKGGPPKGRAAKREGLHSR